MIEFKKLANYEIAKELNGVFGLGNGMDLTLPSSLQCEGVSGHDQTPMNHTMIVMNSNFKIIGGTEDYGDAPIRNKFKLLMFGPAEYWTW